MPRSRHPERTQRRAVKENHPERIQRRELEETQRRSIRRFNERDLRSLISRLSVKGKERDLNFALERFAGLAAMQARRVYLEDSGHTGKPCSPPLLEARDFLKGFLEKNRPWLSEANVKKARQVLACMEKLSDAGKMGESVDLIFSLSKKIREAKSVGETDALEGELQKGANSGLLDPQVKHRLEKNLWAKRSQVAKAKALESERGF